jgi:hypothetical protein
MSGVTGGDIRFRALPNGWTMLLMAPNYLVWHWWFSGNHFVYVIII